LRIILYQNLILKKRDSKKKAYEDVSDKGFISQEYLDLIERELNIVNGLAPRILWVYFNPKLVYNGIFYNGKIKRLSPNDIVKCEISELGKLRNPVIKYKN